MTKVGSFLVLTRSHCGSLLQFHGLKSITLQVPVAATGSEMETCILIKKTEKALSNVNLPQFLKKLKEKDIAAAA